MPCPPTFFSLGFVFGELSKTKVMFVTFCVKSFSLFQTGGNYILCPHHIFIFRFCIWRGCKNKSDICHVSIHQANQSQ